jgi:uncharacterized membrane protein YfcA
VTLTLSQWALALPLGVLFSAVGTLVGLGGGIFMVPLLVLVFGVPFKTAVAVATFCIVPACLLSTAFNMHRRQIDYSAGFALEIPSVIGAIAGAALITLLPVRPMELVFAIVAALLASKVLGGASDNADAGWLDRINQIPPALERHGSRGTYKVGIPAIGVVGFVAGIFAGLFGLGGGVFKTPALVRLFQMPTRTATATALFTMVFTGTAASMSHWLHGRLDWHLALPLAAAFLVGALIGNQFAGTIRSRTVELILGIVLGFAAVAVALHAVFN